MMSKRGSQPGSPATYTSPNRIRSPDASVDYSADLGVGPKDVLSGEQKAVVVLVNKIVSKLPCHSGTRLGMVEVDAGVQASVAALLRMRLSPVGHALTSALEQLLKHPIDSLETLQSQVFILHVLHQCLSASWPTTSTSRSRSDPPPLETDLARYLLSTILTYAQIREQNSSPTSSSRTREMSNGSIARLASSLSSHALTKSSSRHSFQDAPKTRDKVRSGAIASDSTDLATTTNRMQTYLRQIIAFITASNWSIVIAKIRSRIQHLCTTIEENPDLGDLRLIEWADLNRLRLGQLLQELSASFLHIKRHAQIPLASALRQAIWGWIDHHNDELTQLIDSNRRLEGGPDILFDHLNSASDVSSSTSSLRRTRVFYPLMAMLLVLCPDILGRIAMGETGRSSTMGKKAGFVESLRKALSTTKAFEAAASCYVDLIGVASRLGSDGSGVRTVVADTQADLKNGLFYGTTEISDPDLIVSGLVGLYRLNGGDGAIILKMLSSETHRIYALQAARLIAEQGQRLPHFPPISGLRNELAGSVRGLIRNQSAAQGSPELLEALELIIVDPAYAYASTENFSVFLTALGGLCFGASPPAVRFLANQAVCEVLESVKDVPSIARTCGTAVCSVLIDASRQELYEFQTLDWNSIAHSTVALRKTTLAVLSFAEACPESLTSCTQTLPAISVASQAVLTSLLGGDHLSAGMCQPSLSAIKKLLVLVLQPTIQKLEREAPDHPKLGEIRMRLAIYDGMVNMPPAHGRQHYQRNLRSVIKGLTQPSAGSLGVWYSLEAAWRKLSKKIVQAEGNGNKESILGEDESRFWHDVLPALCAFAGILVSTHDSGPSIAEMIGPHLLPDFCSSTEPNRNRAESFIRECVAMTVSPQIAIREAIKAALGTDLPITCAPILFDQLHRSASLLLPISDSAGTFTEQAISILRLMLDRMPASDEVDISELVMLFGRYIHRLGRGEQAIRLKTKFCNVVELAASRTSLNQRFGNNLLDNILEWSDAKLETLEHSALRALVPLTDGLSLQTTDDSQSARQFLRAFTFLVHAITSEDRSVSIATHPSTLDSTSLAVAALANLLAANVDVGLKHCLTLGYHRDPVLRNAFMQIMTHTLQHGPRFGSSTTKRQSTKPRPYLDSLSLSLAVAAVEVCPSSEVDELSMMLFRSFEAKGTLLSFLRVLIEREVSQTNHESELFRANTVTTRLLTHFAKTYGYNYVRSTLQPLIFSLIDKPAETSFELDPAKAGANENIERNADHLKLMCQALLDLIYTSTPKVPVMIKVVAHSIWEAVEDRFPESRHSAVGSFIFLRFFCPSIVAPDNIELEVPTDSRDLRRGLLLITKVIQNLANNVTFGNKEPHMKVLNAFLRSNITEITKYLSDVAARPRGHEIAPTIKAIKEDVEKVQDSESDDMILHKFVYRHMEKLAPALSGLPQSFRNVRSERTPLEGRSTLIQIQALLEQTGPPVELSKLDAYTRTRLYDEYMKQNSGRSIESVQSTFYEGPAGQTGRRIFYFIAANVGLADYDLLAYHIFQTMSDVNEPFDMIFDMTGFAPSNDLPLPWVKRMLQICPPAILSAVHIIALYNANSHTKRRIRRIAAEISPLCGNVPKQTVAVSHPNELQAAIPFVTLDLPDSTMALAYSSVKVYRPIFVVADHEMQVQMGVKVGDDGIQMASWRPAEILPGVKTYIIDVLSYTDIDDVTGETDRLTIKHGTETVTFVSRPDPRSGTSDASRTTLRRLESDLRTARARLRDTPSTQRTLRPTDVPGTLLNIALLNLHSTDETLRSAAYGLMQEIGTFFRYDFGLIKASHILVPRNSLVFAQSLSRSLAVNSPQLTLDFIKEWISSFPRSGIPQQTACVQYIGPWLPNLEAFAKPSRDDAAETVKQVTEIIRGLISLTVSEYTGVHLLLQERVWQPLSIYRGPLMDIMINELLQSAVDAGFGSSRGDCIADILVSMAGTSVRGKVFSRLRKTYLRTSTSLENNDAWSEICVLTRLSAMLAYSPSACSDAQLFLPEILHSLTLLIGCGPVLMRQTTYALFINTLHSLASSPTSGETDASVLVDLLDQAQEPAMLDHFRLVKVANELGGSAKEGDTLNAVEALSKLLGRVIVAAAPSIDCANSWRAKWMGMVASTCFQHNPATQPQAFTVLAALATEEVDDDLIYQVLIAMSSVLKQYSDRYTYLVISMTRCLANMIPALMLDSRYPATLFWIGIGILQMGHIPLFSAGLDLTMSTLAYLSTNGAFAPGLDRVLLEGRTAGSQELCFEVDQMSGVSMETQLHFSLVSVIWKGIRHPASRQKTIDCLLMLSRLSSAPGLPYFVALFPILAGSPVELKALSKSVDLPVPDDIMSTSIFDMLDIRDSSTALLVITLAITILKSASSDVERVILYHLLADACERIPEIVASTFDTFIPRAISVLGNTTNPSIIASVTSIIEHAMANPSYSFPNGDMGPTESTLSLNQQVNSLHGRSYSGSIVSVSSPPSAGQGVRVLEEMGMKGLADMSFNTGKVDRIGKIARIVAALIMAFTT